MTFDWASEGDTKHCCHAIGCFKTVLPKYLMCGKHWKMVSRELQDRIWKHYRPGQEKDKRPTKEYLRAMKLAIEYVAYREGRE